MANLNKSLHFLKSSSRGRVKKAVVVTVVV